jgi:hypothetical protein
MSKYDLDKWEKFVHQAWALGDLACFRLRAEMLLDYIDQKKFSVSDEEREELHRVASEPKPDDWVLVSLGPFDRFPGDDDDD